MGRLIPAGTGLGAYKRLTVDVQASEDDDEDDDVIADHDEESSSVEAEA
jgi:hypothetical protein